MFVRMPAMVYDFFWLLSNMNFESNMQMANVGRPWLHSAHRSLFGRFLKHFNMQRPFLVPDQGPTALNFYEDPAPFLFHFHD